MPTFAPSRGFNPSRLFAYALFVVAILLPLSGQTVSAASGQPLTRLPLKQNSGPWPTSHVQGIAVDLQGGYIYYSFTTLLAKYDFSG
ncbi:MAG: hypothetical protein V4773_13995, partial [Verrucomicrobiota bacterium]